MSEETQEVTKAERAPNAANIDNTKFDLSLLPMDVLSKYLTSAYTEGILKYYRESWRKGFHVSDIVGKMMRHLEKFAWEGENYDKETLEQYQIEKHHIAAVIFSCVCLLHTLEHHPELDDRRNPATGELFSRSSGDGAKQDDKLRELDQRFTKRLKTCIDGQDIGNACVLSCKAQRTQTDTKTER